MEFLIVTGMSGAGKSRAIAALEDIGYYCVDNLPAVLLAQFAQLFLQAQEGETRRAALVADSRGTAALGQFDDCLRAMREQQIPYKVMFLDCEDEVLMQRYKETRRRHPLTELGDTSVTEAIKRERRLLEHIKQAADYLIDTSRLTSAQLRERIVQLFMDVPENAMTVQCMSFGFKYGTPHEADLVLDVRCFPNPFYVDTLRSHTGLEQAVRKFVLDCPESREFEKRLFALLDYMLPLYRNEGKSQLVIAIGCTGGKHRSVTFTEELAAHLRENGARVMVEHRDIKKL